MTARRPTLADVAAEAGVSVALVSIVMREAPGAGAQTRRRVLEVAERLGYRPDSRARLLRSGRSRLLGVVFDVRSPFHGELVTGLYAAAEKLGYELALSAMTPRREERAAVAGLLQDRCEAMLVMSLTSTTADLAALAERMPLVVLARGVRHRSVDVVRNDDAQGMRKAVDHLVELGHRRIAHVDGGRHAGSADRRRGYVDAMRQHGLEHEIRVVTGGPADEHGVHGARGLLADPPTAVTMYNDQSAIGALDLLRRSGFAVPAQISVVGYDDERSARMGHIDLTTVAQDTAMMTTLAVARAEDRIRGVPVAQRETVIPPQLVVRGTTGPAPS
jgi:DNA-binding LacI/PurR family transcriptional regulator